MFSIPFSTIKFIWEKAPEFPIVGLRWNEIKILELIMWSLLSSLTSDEELPLPKVMPVSDYHPAVDPTLIKGIWNWNYTMGYTLNFR